MNLDMDSFLASDTDPEGSCLSVGSFYADWAWKFVIPLIMAAFTMAICVLTRMAAHEVRHSSGSMVAIWRCDCRSHLLY
jgi:hypothetical protein